MTASGFFTTLLRFFYDSIGLVVPGFVFLIGLGLMHIRTGEDWPQIATSLSANMGVVLIVISYAVGHVLLSLYSPIRPVIRKLFSGKSKIEFTSIAYRTFHQLANRRLKESVSNTDELADEGLRSLAMSVLPEAAEQGRRFMFLSLLCAALGIGLFLLMLSSFLGNPHEIARSWEARASLSVVAAFLFWQGIQFEKTAMDVPFAVALSAVIFSAHSNPAAMPLSGDVDTGGDPTPGVNSEGS